MIGDGERWQELPASFYLESSPRGPREIRGQISDRSWTPSWRRTRTPGCLQTVVPRSRSRVRDHHQGLTRPPRDRPGYDQGLGYAANTASTTTYLRGHLALQTFPTSPWAWPPWAWVPRAMSLRLQRDRRADAAPHHAAHKLTKRLSSRRKRSDYLRPTGSQVTVAYDGDSPRGGGRHHLRRTPPCESRRPEDILRRSSTASSPPPCWTQPKSTHPTVRFVWAAPRGLRPHRPQASGHVRRVGSNAGGAFSARPRQVARSASDCAHIAKNILAAACRPRETIRVAIGVPTRLGQPTLAREIEEAARGPSRDPSPHPQGISEYLNLRRPIYIRRRPTALRAPSRFTWDLERQAEAPRSREKHRKKKP